MQVAAALETTLTLTLVAVVVVVKPHCCVRNGCDSLKLLACSSFCEAS